MDIPADTSKAALVEQKKKIRTGIITHIEVLMPPGCHKLVYATVSHRLTQLMPFNPDEAVRADTYPVVGDYYWSVTESSPELILRGWSPDTIYDHTVSIRITVLPKAVASMLPLVNVLTKFLQRIGVIS